MTMNQYIVYLVIRINVEMPNASPRRDTPRILYIYVLCPPFLATWSSLFQISREFFNIESTITRPCFLYLNSILGEFLTILQYLLE